MGRSRLLDNDDGLYSSVSPIRVAGRFLAWGFEEIPSCKADCPPGITGVNHVGVVDLRSGRRKTSDAKPSALVATRFGAIAWIDGSTTEMTVMAWDGAGKRVLDRGAIAVSPFRLYGASVLWRNAGVGRWEELRR